MRVHVSPQDIESSDTEAKSGSSRNHLMRHDKYNKRSHLKPPASNRVNADDYHQRLRGVGGRGGGQRQWMSKMRKGLATPKQALGKLKDKAKALGIGAGIAAVGEALGKEYGENDDFTAFSLGECCKCLVKPVPFIK